MQKKFRGSPRNKLQWVDKRFSLLTVIGEIRGTRLVEAVCDCGKVGVYDRFNLKQGFTKSCGCKRSSQGGLSRLAEYRSWVAMRKRCSGKSSYHEKYYKGVQVSKSWESFQSFLKDMGYKPSPAHTLERIKNSGNYELSNCRWATMKEQVKNRRPRGTVS